MRACARACAADARAVRAEAFHYFLLCRDAFAFDIMLLCHAIMLLMRVITNAMRHAFFMPAYAMPAFHYFSSFRFFFRSTPFDIAADAIC